MSRYRPQVAPIAGATLGDALMDGVNGFMQERERRRRMMFQDRAESRAGNADLRAGNVDTRAQAELQMRQEDQGMQRDAFAFDKSLRPATYSKAFAGAMDAGVRLPTDPTPRPANAVPVPGQSDYDVDPSRTPGARTERYRAGLQDLAKDRIGLQRAAIASREKISNDNIKGRRDVAGVRASGAAAQNGPLGQAVRLLTDAQRRVAALTRLQAEGYDDPDTADALKTALGEVDYYSQQEQVLMRDAARRSGTELPDRSAAPKPGAQFFGQPFNGFGGGNNAPMPSYGAPPAQAVAPTPTPSVAPQRPAQGAPPPPPMMTKDQIDAEAADALRQGVDSGLVARRRADLYQKNGVRQGVPSRADRNRRAHGLL